MNKLFPTLLLALLLGSCTRADTLLPTTIANTGRYLFAGHLVNCQAEALMDASYSPEEAVEIIDISLTPTSAGQMGSPTLLNLEFKRPAGQLNAAYQLTHCYQGSERAARYRNAVATIQETSNGVFTGTFSSTESGESTISEGIFTQVRAKPLTD